MNADKVEIPRMILQYEDKIHEDISKMVEYGELIYTGKNPIYKDSKTNAEVNIYLCNNWLILLDVKDNAVITLYEKDNSDINAKAMFEEYYIAKEAADIINTEFMTINSEIQTKLKENDIKIQQMNAEISRLRTESGNLRNQMSKNYNKIKEAELKANKLFEKIIKK